MNNVHTTLDGIQKKLQQQSFDVSVLALWSHAKATTGLTEDDIRAFTFRPEFLTPEEAKKNKDAKFATKPPVYCDKNWHNALRLHDESLVPMPGITRPTPPAWIGTSVGGRI